MRDDEKFVRISNAVCVKSTERAVCVNINGEDHWLPRSQMGPGNEIEDEGDDGTLVCSEWIAGEKGLTEETDSSAEIPF